MSMTTDTRSNKLIRAPETFRRLGMSPSTGYKAIRDGTMPVEPIPVGGQWKFRAADVDRVVEGAEIADHVAVAQPAPPPRNARHASRRNTRVASVNK